MTATQLSLKLRSRICNWLFHQRRTDVFNENMINTFIAYDTWLKTPFCTLNAGGESPLDTQKTPPPFSLLSKSGVSLYGQICSHELMSTLSNRNVLAFANIHIYTFSGEINDFDKFSLRRDTLDN